MQKRCRTNQICLPGSEHAVLYQPLEESELRRKSMLLAQCRSVWLLKFLGRVIACRTPNSEENCSCTQLGVDIQAVHRILNKTNSFPILRIDAYGDWKSVAVTVEEYTVDKPYVALSHVSDTLTLTPLIPHPPSMSRLLFSMPIHFQNRSGLTAWGMPMKTRFNDIRSRIWACS